MATPRDEPIVISDDEDNNMEWNSAISSTTSGNRKRAPDLLLPGRPPKRSRSNGQQSATPPVASASSLQRPTSMPASLPVAHRFSYPSNSQELSEEVVSLLLHEDETIEFKDAWEAPVRRLSGFTFFDGSLADTIRPVVALDKLRSRITHGHGTARVAYPEADEELIDNEDDARQIGLRWKSEEVLLGQVEDWWMGDGINNADIYIRTRHAWYILEEPSPEYRSEYSRFWRCVRIPQVALAYAQERMGDGIEEFGDYLQNQFSRESNLIIGRAITRNDLDLMIPFIQRHFASLTDAGLKEALLRTELVNEIMKLPFPSRQGLPDKSIRPPPALSHVGRKTVVSPLVAQIAQRYFFRSFEIIGHSPSVIPSGPELSDSHLLEKKLPRVQDSNSRTTVEYYEVLKTQDGRKCFEVGDCVAVRIGRQDGVLQSVGPNLSSKNEFATKYWFARIIRLFITHDMTLGPFERPRWAHVQWFLHGTATDLAELASPHELFLTYECNDIGLSTIHEVIQVNMVKCNEQLVIPEEDIDQKVFFCRLTWDDIDGSFSDLSQPMEYEKTDIDFHSQHSDDFRCDACLTKKCMQWRLDGRLEEVKSTQKFKSHGANYANTTFHDYDTILYQEDPSDVADQRNNVEEGQLVVGQIRKWIFPKVSTRSTFVQIRKLAYFDNLIKRRTNPTQINPVMHNIPLDERRLYRTKEVTEIPIEHVVRKCVVSCSPSWEPHSDLKSEPDHFFLTHDALKAYPTSPSDLKLIDPAEFEFCTECRVTERLYAKYRDGYKTEQRYRLKTLDLCAGAGGLSLGLMRSGAFEPRWAVEKDPSPARTYRKNFPGATVYVQDLNVCVKNALQPDDEKEDMPALDGKASNTPTMPKPGEVEAIIAGPPCPDFSTQNIYRGRAGESNTGLVLGVLSMIDLYRPKFFFIENVPGMLSHELIDRETGEPVTYAMIKMILRTLTTLGYNIRWGMFNAANYGAPHDRHRLMFYGSCGGHPLPELPQPTHLTVKSPRTNFRRPSDYMTKLTTSLAPHLPVTLASAIGDLPAFEWKVYHPLTDLQPRHGIVTVYGESPKAKHPAGYVNGTRYQQAKPMTLYQARMRESGERKVLMHYTKTFASGKCHKAERVMSVHMIVNADHRSIPPVLYEWGFSHALSAAARKRWAPGHYGRLDWEGLFQSLITRIEPTAKQGRVLHPSQRRVLSLREIARAQGFPDDFKFYEDDSSIIRQIGNAVPVPLAEAFGRVFRDALIANKMRKDRKDRKRLKG